MTKMGPAKTDTFLKNAYLILITFARNATFDVFAEND